MYKTYVIQLMFQNMQSVICVHHPLHLVTVFTIYIVIMSF